MIETKPLCASSSNLADMLAIVSGWTLLNFVGQRSKVKLTIDMDMYGNKLVNTIYKPNLFANDYWV